MNKVCSVCLIEQNITEFPKAASGKDGVARHCKQCDRARYRAYYAVNKAKVLLNKAKYQSENPEKHQKYNKKHYNNNKASYRRRDMAAQICRKRQTPSWLSKAYIAEMDGIYEFCQVLKCFGEFQVDHILPVRGKEISGLHVPWNLQVLTRRENVKKSNTFNPSIYSTQV
jgi:hypothetical protein